MLSRYFLKFHFIYSNIKYKMILASLLCCIVLSTGITSVRLPTVSANPVSSFRPDEILAESVSNDARSQKRSLSSYTDVDFSTSTVTKLDHEFTAVKYQYFGSAMAIDVINNDYLIIGAPGDNFNTRYGAAYIYDLKSNGLLSILDTHVVDDFFGAAVAISGNNAIVGAYK